MPFSPLRRISLSLTFVFFAATAVSAAERGNGRVELRIRVVTPYREFTRAFWNVTVTAPSGIPLEQIAETGGTVVFRGLAPASYPVCITGVRGRHRCTTVEVAAPVTGSRARHDVELEAPRSNISLTDLRRPNSSEAGVLAVADGGAGLESEGTKMESENTPTASAAAQPKPLQPNLIR